MVTPATFFRISISLLQGWSLLSIFVSTILGLILDPLPVGAWALIAITVTLATNTLTFAQVRDMTCARKLQAMHSSMP